jgi:hypothetical protein
MPGGGLTGLRAATTIDGKPAPPPRDVVETSAHGLPPLIEIEMPQMPRRRFGLRERVARGGDGGGALPAYVELSEPAVITLNETYASADEELRFFLSEERARYRYDLVRLGCTFNPTEGEPFERARLEIELEAEDARDVAPPVAWSMEPETGFESVELSRNVQIGTELRFVSGSATRSAKSEQKEYFLRAYRLQKHNPYWELRRTGHTDIIGHYSFNLIFRSAVASRTRGVIGLGATVRKRKFILMHEEESFPDRPFLEFRTPA